MRPSGSSPSQFESLVKGVTIPRRSKSPIISTSVVSLRNDIEIQNARFPLLLLYLLNPEKAGLPESKIPIVGFAIRFPGSSRNRTITYAVHEQLLDKFEVNEDPEDYDYQD